MRAAHSWSKAFKALHLKQFSTAMAPKANCRGGAPGPRAKQRKVKQPKMTYNPADHICRNTQKWITPLPVSFIESTAICKELKRINEMIGRRFADRRLKNGEKVERPRAKEGKRVRVVAYNRADTLELDEFFREWQEPLRALKRNHKAMLDVEEHIRMSNKILKVYCPESGIKEGPNEATETVKVNVQLVGQAMKNLGLVEEQEEEYSWAPRAYLPPASSASDPPAHDPPAHVLEHEYEEDPRLDAFGDLMEQEPCDEEWHYLSDEEGEAV